ncbi:MAG: RagB/SusD family nutrient uptake outer membrane protein [Longimicrobiales bacterium]|nr:RagB/SusD family nutrient uptake outer membrane protein [Longimicrobiales bacterium]
MNNMNRIRGRARMAGRIWAVLLAGAALSGCDAMDKLLEVETPALIPAANLEGPQHATLLLNGAIGDFEAAFTGHILQSSFMGGELYDATSTANRWLIPARTVTNIDTRYNDQSYTPLSRARWTADNILKLLQGWSDADVADRQLKIATAAVYSGFSLVLLGESFCTLAIDLSAEMQPAAVFQKAEERFTNAITAAQAAGSSGTKWLNAAYVGRARARLDLGNGAGASADAALVTTGFRFDATYSSAATRRYNALWDETRTGYVSVTEPFRNLTVGGVADPRVAVVDQKRNGWDALTPLWNQTLYTSWASPIPIARWEEAQLIVAEVAGGTTAVTIINNLRSRRGLPATYTGGTAAEIKAQVIDERRRELFLDGHRLGDLRRYSLPLFPAVGLPYPKGGNYGDRTCFPLPNVEIQANPNISK